MAKRLGALVLVIVMALTCSVGVALIGNTFFPSSENPIVEEEKPANFDVDFASTATRTDDEDGITLKFSAPTTFNTVALSEISDVIREFRFYYLDGESKKFFYKQDLVGSYRYCSFEPVTTSELRIDIVGEEGEIWDVSEINVYNMQKTNTGDFRVSAYVVSQYVYNLERLDKDHFRAINHVNLISTVYIAADGELYFRDDYIDGVLVDGEKIFEASLKNVREVMQEGTTVVCTLLGQDYNGSGLSTVEIHESAFKTHKDNFIKNAVAFQEKYGLDGLSFDYEYPENMAQYATMFETCRTLKENMKAGSIMTVALGSWVVQKPFQCDKSLFNCVDWVESMNYDEMKYANHNYHSPFSTSCHDFISYIEDFNKTTYELNGKYNEFTYVDIKDINLGIPFYSRPIDGRGYWGEYRFVAESLGRFENVKYDEYHNGELLPPTYYNSYQMVYDKVAYCLDYGVGGVMVWNYSCDASWDSGLSLWHAIYDAVQSRS